MMCIVGCRIIVDVIIIAPSSTKEKETIDSV